MPETGDLPSQRMLSVYLIIQVTSLVDNTTLCECLVLLRHVAFNSPFTCQLEMLLSLKVFLEFPFSVSEMTRTIRLVGVLDNQ